MIEKTMLATLCLFITVLQCCEGKTQTTSEKIEYLTAYKTSPIKAYARNVSNVEELSSAIDSASEKYKINVNYLIVIAWFETVFRNLTGDGGKSLGEMQVGKMGRRKCKCEMGNVTGRIECGACWLNMGRTWCGTLERGLQAYVSGKCEPRTARQAWAKERRIRIIKKLEKLWLQ